MTYDKDMLYYDDAEEPRELTAEEARDLKRRLQETKQREHEASIAKQKMKLKRIKIKGAIDDSDLVGTT